MLLYEILNVFVLGFLVILKPIYTGKNNFIVTCVFMIGFDEYGPEKIVEVYDPKVGMHGFVVIDNTALGPGKGGIRMTPTVSKSEVSRLARAMTWKCSLAGLPFGGAKSGIIANPRELDLKKKRKIVESFSKALKVVGPEKYVAAPDMNMAEKEMEWFAKANGSKKSCTGKPKKLGGIPHELGSTGFGVYHATLVALKAMNCDPKDMKLDVAIEGFGNVGWFAAKFLSEAGLNIVAVSDSKGTAYKKDGFDFEKLAKVKKEQRTVTKYPGAKVLPNKKILSIPAEVLITAAIPDLIQKADVKQIKSVLIVEGSNIPMSHETEKMLHEKEVLVIPDFVANAGGVISSYVEYINGTSEKMFKLVESKIKKNTKEILKARGEDTRTTAMKLAQKRVKKAMK